MEKNRRLPVSAALRLGLLAASVGAAAVAYGDTVVLTNGVVYRGTVDRDRPLLWVYDGLKRVVLRDSKVKRIDPDSAFGNLEEFSIVQPLVVHGGSMPKEVIAVEASPWNDRGRRTFVYEGSRLG